MSVRQCQCCGVIENGKELSETLSLFRKSLICSFCHRLWLSQEQHLGHEIDITKLKQIDCLKKKKHFGKGHHKRKVE